MNISNTKNTTTEDEKLKLRHFVGIGLLAFVYTLESIEYRWNDFVENTKQRIKTRLKLQKELIVNPTEIKEKTFNLKYYNQKITNKAVDKFLLLNEESVNSELIRDIMIYSLHNNYKDTEVINKAFYIPEFSIKDMLDNYAFISIKNPEIAFTLLKKEQFISKVQEEEFSHELILKPLRRQSYEVVTKILNDEEILKIITTNSKKLLKGLLNQVDNKISEDILKNIEEKIVFSKEHIKEEVLERVLGNNIANELGKTTEFKPSDIWLKNQMIKIEHERLEKKYPEKNIKVKPHKI